MNKSKEIQKLLQQKIKDNTKFLDEINQYLHNKGIELTDRYNIVTDILLGKECTEVSVQDWVKDKLTNITINKNEIYQIVFMFFGNQYFKKQLDQFYTPMTICNFINSLLIPGRSAIDPACGTGDLLNQYKGTISLVDKCSSVLEMTRFISTHLANDAIIENKDSLATIPDTKYDYCIMNPPFGSKTVVTDSAILEKYELGKGKEKQEIGILFVEMGLKILKTNGILFAIVPNGYLGNTNSNYVSMRKLIIDKYTLVGIIKLPDGAFSRSGTGVATSIMIIQNKKQETDYPVFIRDVNEIGYILNKKNTPFKYKTDEKGEYLYDESINPIIDEGLTHTKELMGSFIYKQQISNLVFQKTSLVYETFKISDMDKDLIFDIKRYLDVYKNVIANCVQRNYQTLEHYCLPEIDFKFTKTKPQYNYIAIKSVNSPLYTSVVHTKVTLPARGKYAVQKGDVLISKLKGRISFTVITESMDNLIASNGFMVIRPKDNKSLVIIFANLFTESFKTQHQSMVTGSIMETLSDDNIKNIYINEAIDFDKYNSILSSIAILNKELVTLG
jgi:type I restriction enzyme M protein